MTLPVPTNQESVIAAAVWRLFQEIWQAPHPVRLVGVGVSGLRTVAQYRSLWESTVPLEEQRQPLETTLAELRVRYGVKVVRWGREWKAGR
jgi:hypothetical protein